MSDTGLRRVRRVLMRYRVPVSAYLATVAVVYLVVVIDRNPGHQGQHFGIPQFVQDMNRWDGPEYVKIATSGYEPRSLVWFPLYPLLIRIVTFSPLAAPHAGVLVTLVAGLVAVAAMWRWLELKVPNRGARLAGLAVLMSYPYAWYLYGVVYADALFLALAIGSFLLVERRAYVWAGVVGALATATRPTGMFLVLPLLLRAAEVEGVLKVPDRASVSWMTALRLPIARGSAPFRRRVLAPLLAVGGVVAYAAFAAFSFGEPLGFIEEQRNYHGTGWRILIKQQYFDAWHQGYDVRHLATTTAQFALVVATLCSVGVVARRFGWAYGLWVAGVAAFPAATVSTFMGSGRYLIPAFPLWALLGEWLNRHRRVAAVVFPVAVALLGLMTVGFSRSWYLS